MIEDVFTAWAGTCARHHRSHGSAVATTLVGVVAHAGSENICIDRAARDLIARGSRTSVVAGVQ